MDNELTSDLKKEELPIWDCALSPKTKDPGTVGDIKDLTCRGTEFVAPGKTYKIVVDYEQENFLRILEVVEDSNSYKTFKVTSYRPSKGDLKIEMEKDGEPAFTSIVKGLNTESVAKTPEEKQNFKEVPPLMGYYVLPSTYEVVFISIFILSMLGIITLRFLNKLKKVKDFKRVISGAKYTDPFMDFNIEMRDFSAQKKKSTLFLGQLEGSLKKVFYRVFNDTVSFSDMSKLVKSLKGLGLEPHEIRSFYVLEEEYKKFQNNYKTESVNFFEFKKSFIDQTKKTINKLKRYSKEGDQ